MNNKQIIVRAALESLVGWVLLALLMPLWRDVTFVQALISPYTIGIAISAFLGCYAGYLRKARKKVEL